MKNFVYILIYVCFIYLFSFASVRDDYNWILIDFGIVIFMCFIMRFIKFFRYIELRIKPFEKRIGIKIKKKNVKYFRDIPCNKDIFQTFFIAYESNLIKEPVADFLVAIIVKWMKEKRVTLETQKDNVQKKVKTQYLFFKEKEKFEEPIESNLYSLIYSATNNGFLKKKEFKEWCKKEGYRLYECVEKILEDEYKKCLDTKKIRPSFVVGEKPYYITNDLEEQVYQIFGLREYLLNYGNISEKEPIEVILYEEYLIFAQLLNISKKVEKRFGNIYPDFIGKYAIAKVESEFVKKVCDDSRNSVAESYSNKKREDKKRAKEIPREERSCSARQQKKKKAKRRKK